MNNEWWIQKSWNMALFSSYHNFFNRIGFKWVKSLNNWSIQAYFSFHVHFDLSIFQFTCIFITSTIINNNMCYFQPSHNLPMSHNTRLLSSCPSIRLTKGGSLWDNDEEEEDGSVLERLHNEHTQGSKTLSFFPSSPNMPCSSNGAAAMT